MAAQMYTPSTTPTTASAYGSGLVQTQPVGMRTARKIFSLRNILIVGALGAGVWFFLKRRR